jgi:drug/metabolite transporter (DMT)-like permease
MPVVFVAFISLLLGRGDQIGGLAYAGFIIVTTGCLFLPLSRFSEIRLKNYRQSWILFALLAALCISGYTLMDDQALRMLRSLPGTDLSNLGWSLLFVELEAISITVFLAVFLSIFTNYRREMIRPGSGGWRMALLMGAIITGTYTLVLLAMAYVSNVSYVIAFRQLSIPIGAMLGILVRKESTTTPKILGITLVFIGLVLAALG